MKEFLFLICSVYINQKKKKQQQSQICLFLKLHFNILVFQLKLSN